MQSKEGKIQKSNNTSIGNFVTNADVLKSDSNISRGSERRTSIMDPKGEASQKNTQKVQDALNKKDFIKETQKEKSSSLGTKTDVPKKSSTGGVLVTGKNQGNTQNKNQSLVVNANQTSWIGIQDVVETILKKRQLSQRQTLKLTNNFTLYSQEQRQKSSIQSITKQIQAVINPGQNPQKLRILDLTQISSLQIKQRLVVNQFLISLIQNACEKKKFISVKSCFEILKYYIRSNADIYQKNGQLDVKIFAKQGLSMFPIVNSKITINTNHPNFVELNQKLQKLIQNLYKGLSSIFKEMEILKRNNFNTYLTIFKKLEQDSQKKKKAPLIKNLFSTFKYHIRNLSQENFDQNVIFIQSIAESLWSCYATLKESFTQKQCFQFIEFLNESQIIFNDIYLKKQTSQSYKRLNEAIQKLIINFILNFPFTIKKWNRQFQALIFQTNLIILKPFMYLSEADQRDEYIDIIQYPTGMHWKYLLDEVIKLNFKEDNDTNSFIINSIYAILKQNSQLFWEDPIEFESFLGFTKSLIRQKQFDRNRSGRSDTFQSMLRIAIALMGKSQFQLTGYSSDQQYPLNNKLPFSLQVHSKFSEYFMGMSNDQFFDIWSQQIKSLILQSNQNLSRQNRERQNRKVLDMKQFTLKLISSQPHTLISLQKYLKNDLTCEDLLNFLILDTLDNLQQQNQLFDITVVSIDNLLLHSQTKQFISSLLCFNSQFNIQLFSVIQSIFKYSENLSTVYRHVTNLIDLNYQRSQWCQSLLKFFYNQSRNTKNIEFAISYSRLLSNMFSRLNTNELAQKRKIFNLKSYINFDFIIQFIKFNLKVNYFRQSYINIQLHQLKKIKAEALMQSIRLFNIILRYFYLRQNIIKPYNVPIDTLRKQDKLFNLKKIQQQLQHLQKIQQTFFPTYFLKQIGIKDEKQYSYQIVSNQHNTTYASALFVILLNSNKNKQQQLLRQTYFDYEQLIVECIQFLIKINPKKNPKSWFIISSSNFYVPMSSQSGELETKQSFLNQFINYVDQTLNITGIQTLVFSNIIEDQKKLINIIDKLRTKLEDRKVYQRTKKQLIYKALGTLSRYFRNVLNNTEIKCIKKGITLQQTEMFSLKTHLQFLVKTIMQLSLKQFYNSKQQKSKILIILSNIYNGFSTLSRFDKKQFLKWTKNYYKIIFNQLNFTNIRYFNPTMIQTDANNILTEQYFQLVQMIVNIWQYGSDKQIQNYLGIQGFQQKLNSFVLYIVQDIDYQLLPNYVSQILLEILIGSINFVIAINKKQRNQSTNLSRGMQSYQKIIKKVFNQMQRKSIIFSNSLNYVILNLILCNQLSIPNESQINPETNYWPLDLILSQPTFSTNTIKIIIQNLNKQVNNNLYFVGFAKALLSYINQTSYYEWDKSNLTSSLFSLFKFYNSLSYSNLNNPQNKPQKIAYRKIWIIQLLMTLIDRSQLNENSVNSRIVQKQFEKFMMEEDGLLTRLGYLMRKMAFFYAQIDIEWIPTLQRIQQFQSLSHKSKSNQLTYIEKLQLNQLLKLVGFITSSKSWNTTFSSKYEYFIQALGRFRRIFEKLPFSNKMVKSITEEQNKLAQIPIVRKDRMNTSAIRQFQRQNVSSESFKSANYFQLMDEILSFQIVCQYSILCLSIPFQNNFSTLFKKNHTISDMYNWGLLFIGLSQAISTKFIYLVSAKDQLQGVLKTFSQKHYFPTNRNYKFSEQVLFTNSVSLTTCLNSEYQNLISYTQQTLQVLFDTISNINIKLRAELRKQQSDISQKFLVVIRNIKKVDKNSNLFQYQNYDPKDMQQKMTRTLRQNFSKTFSNFQSQKKSGNVHNI